MEVTDCVGGECRGFLEGLRGYFPVHLERIEELIGLEVKGKGVFIRIREEGRGDCCRCCFVHVRCIAVWGVRVIHHSDSVV